ncbi:MAG TPA: precorrin-2 C(20)-methyltransferase [Candidatus Mediterraneibacter quadrami]|uniref:Precorrin-2 C(20)-methyltransferase n=1 Tax=Candidatus Mediterraneibacter quadrami TaxID=2838684 RepID=A0A9D2RDV5_9FIRM|nr:precorrin-2 C(20)-methyltransferase [Candidatus Mediterraneibacter quadrami]
MSGIFTGIGTGPGDPELMTLKAVKVICACSVIALPVSDPTLEKPVYEAAGPRTEEPGKASGPDTGRYLAKCVAWQIAAGAVPEIGEKDRIWLPMPMIKDKEKLKTIHDRDAEALAELLDAGKDVAFLTLGDPTVYSTCMYVHKRLKRMGYETRIVPGIPSFCAAAARMDVPLAENRQEIHILPASYDIENSLELPGTKVLMKAGRKMADVKRLLHEKGLDAMMVENCGMEEERIYLSTGDIPEEAGYYSLLVVKEKNGRGGERA